MREEKYNQWRNGCQIGEEIAFAGAPGRYEVIDVDPDGRIHVQPATPDAWSVATLRGHFAQKKLLKEAH